MIELLVSLLFLAVFIYVVVLVMGMIPLPAQVKQIVYVILGLIFLVMLLDKAGLYHLALQ